ncbi:pirin family protein [Oceanobacter mangrovi]|uniref:pirin family protein n=1 Tax=Oceanobacter mangrovi TaxID=2862510 RepID=UPI001C8DD3BD|nr:pirin family protein [Oceanobacter mangrovi]
MIYLRRAADRGLANFGWLNSHHSFSFGHYYDPQHMGWGLLRVINDDTVDPAAGFDPHGHRDMEIISYVLQGALHHKDSTGRESVLRAGEVQRMTAGSGIVHSEYNHSSEQPVHFLQIWIRPASNGLEPGYEQKVVPQQGSLTALVSHDQRGESLKIHQDVVLSRLQLEAGESRPLAISQRAGYLHLIEGELEVAVDDNDKLTLTAGDALGVNQQKQLQVSAHKPVTALWFDLPVFAQR